MDDKKCSACGYTISASFKFCPKCGKPVEPLTYTCKCGKEWPMENNFCPLCGTPNPHAVSSQHPVQLAIADSGGNKLQTATNDQTACRKPNTDHNIASALPAGNGQLQSTTTDEGDHMSSVITVGDDQSVNTNINGDDGMTNSSKVGNNQITDTRDDAVTGGNDQLTSTVTDGNHGVTSSTTDRNGEMSGTVTGGNNQMSRTMTGRDCQPIGTITGRDDQVSGTITGGDDQLSGTVTGGDQMSSTETGRDNQMSITVTGKGDQIISTVTGRDDQISGAVKSGSDQTTDTVKGRDSQLFGTVTGEGDQVTGTVTDGDDEVSSTMPCGDNQMSGTVTGRDDQTIGAARVRDDEMLGTMTSGDYQMSGTVSGGDQMSSSVTVRDDQITGTVTARDDQMPGKVKGDGDKMSSTKTGGYDQIMGIVTSRDKQMSGTVTVGGAQASSTVTCGEDQISGTVTARDDQMSGPLTHGSDQMISAERGGANQIMGTVTGIGDQITVAVTGRDNQLSGTVTGGGDQMSSTVRGEDNQITGTVTGTNDKISGTVKSGSDQNTDTVKGRDTQLFGTLTCEAGQVTGTVTGGGDQIPITERGGDDQIMGTVTGRDNQMSGTVGDRGDQMSSTVTCEDDQITGPVTGGGDQMSSTVAGQNDQISGAVTGGGHDQDKVQWPRMERDNMGERDKCLVNQDTLGILPDADVGTDVDKNWNVSDYNIRKTDEDKIPVSRVENMEKGAVKQEMIKPTGEEKFTSTFGADVKKQPISNKDDHTQRLLATRENGTGTHTSAITSASSDGNQKQAEVMQTRNTDQRPEISQKSNNSKLDWRYPDDQLCWVTFRVVISPDFKFSHSQHKVLILFPYFQDICRVMELDRTESGDNHTYYVMKLTLGIPKQYIHHEATFLYRYAVLKNGKEENEFLYHKSNGEDNQFRNLTVKKTSVHIVPAEWHQYDGMVHRQPDTGFFERFKSYVFQKSEFERFEKYNIRSAAILLPQWEGFCDQRTIEEVLSEISQVRITMRPLFVDKNLEYDGGKQFGQALSNYTNKGIKRLEQHQQQLEEGLQTSRRQKITDIVTALSIVHLYRLYDLQMTKPNVNEAVFYALCVTPDNQAKSCPEYEEVLQTDDKSLKKDVGISLLMYCENMFTHGYIHTTWLFAVPFIHFLLEDLAPFERLMPSVKHESAAWWGLEHLVKEVNKFKTAMASKHQMPIDLYMKYLVPMFELDPLLPRTLMAVMSPCHLRELFNKKVFAPEICLANLSFFMKIDKYFPRHVKTIAELVQPVKSQLQKNQEVVSTDLRFELPQASATGTIAVDFLEHALRKITSTGHFNVTMSAVSVVISSIDRLGFLLAPGISDQNAENILNPYEIQHQDLVRRLAAAILEWCGRTMPRCMMNKSGYQSYTIADPTELQIFDSLVDVRFRYSENLTAFWSENVLQYLKNRLSQVSPHAQIDLFCNLRQGCSKKVENQISECVLDAIASENMVDLSLHSAKLDQVNSHQEALRLGWFFAAMFVNSWPKENDKPSEDSQEILKHVLEWTLFNRFLKFFYKYVKAQQSSVLTDDCCDLVGVAVSLLDQLLTSLTSGEIHIGTLNLILENSDSLVSIFKTMKDNSQMAEADCEIEIGPVLKQRKKELEAFKLQKTYVRNMVNACSHFPVNIEQLQEKLNTDTRKLLLSEVCVTEKGRQTNPGNVIQDPVVHYFDLSDKVLAMAQGLTEYNTTSTFSKIWTAMGKEAHSLKVMANGDCSLTLDEILGQVWPPVYKEITSLCDKLNTGNLTLAEVDKLYADYKGKYKELKVELKQLWGFNRKCDWVDDRVSKIEKYHMMNRYKEGAEKMKKVVQVLGLTGNFTVLDTLVSMDEDKSACLGDISDNVISVGEELMGVTDEMANCISEVGKCQDLVSWLKKLEGTREVTVLVDLAMMSAQGQNDLEVERVQCLSDAAMNYAPLIYELKENADFPEFMRQCQVVWERLKTKPDLPKRLSDLSRDLEWLENIEKSHGSTETNSLSQVQTINSRGMFKVGYIETLAVEQQNQNLDNVIELVILPEQQYQPNVSICDKKCEVTTLSLQQLNDLQSRLMLVVGSNEERKSDVDRFVEILDGVTGLGKLYTRLSSAGSIIFRKWQATFYCNPDNVHNTDIDFGLSDNMLHAPKGVSLTSQIMELCKFLEDCLHQLIEDINHKRQEFYQLNHFTTEQLVILRSDLATVWTGKQGQPETYALLHAVKPGCTTQDLQQALSEAYTKLVTNVQDSKGDNTRECEESGRQSICVDGETGTSSNQNQTEAIAKFIQELVKSGVSRSLALEATKHIEVSDVQEGIMWCMENEDLFVDEETTTPTHQDIPSRGAVADWDLGLLMKHCTNEDVAKSLLEALNQNNSSLKETLENLWREHMHQSGISSVSDFLSLQHLGVILEELAKQDKQSLNRPFHKDFTKGKPNLVVCPEGEILVTVMSMYMYDQGSSLPLPSACEVLMCNPDTSTEEVDLLLRRCFHCPDNRLFCMVNADLLDYEVSCHTEKSYKELSQVITKKDFRLVVVCSSEHSNKSSLVTAFDKFRIKNQFVCTAREIQAYLKDKFTVQSKVMKTVDPESLCVRMVQSHRAGVGKSLKVLRIAERLKKYGLEETHISIHKRSVDREKVIQQLLPKTQPPEQHKPHLVHIDIACEVQEGVDELLFSLLILGRLTANSGHVWLRSDLDLYVVEVLPLMERVLEGKNKTVKSRHVHTILPFLPKLTCWDPKDSLFLLHKIQQAEPGELYLTTHPDYQHFDQLMDRGQFKSESWQRVYQYLKRYQHILNLDSVNPNQVEGTEGNCIETLLRYCGLTDPSWAELRHFVHFLDIQLKDCEQSVYCSEVMSRDLPGFKNFVIKFMIQMSRDFATRSLNISEETTRLIHADEKVQDENKEGIEQFQMKRTWESSPHPYLFFNSDHESLTFLGFNIEQRTCNMIDLQTKEILEQRVMTRLLYYALTDNFVPLQENFDELKRAEKITKLCNVMGNSCPGELDDTYVLTTDNVKKILAIYMRFRCDIPVIIMGETGCGKTRLVRFLCELQKPAGAEVENMVLMKVHGGTTESDIQSTLEKAKELARKNKQVFPHMYTVLFFDEANTTEEIGLIKQVMCDEIFTQNQAECGLKIVAACNPYRKHSDEMVKRLEEAGLGYHIKAEQTTDKLGHIPLRRLVYRVQALPQSLLPLVWDFGQLDTKTEEMYIQQMVAKFASTAELTDAVHITPVVSKILAASQDYMRKQNDECSFVSLRDVERVLNVMAWFYHYKDLLYSLMERRAEELFNDQYNAAEKEFQYRTPDDLTRSLVLALGVCYQACLQEKRKAYRDHVAQHFIHPLTLFDGANTIEEQINSCQEVFLSHVSLGENIAHNQALKENVFMMVVCIELRIPLFLVGKPGSSKSLAKTIVADAMQGDTSKTDLFKKLKFVHMVSFQCSPLSFPEGIVGMFHQCATLQQKKELDKYVSVVVLDEVGLAEDSPRMPLKALHPLLEDGCQGNEKPEPYKKVAFIGISNWALDPAKMNRGILVQRGVPDEAELVRSARGICSGNTTKRPIIDDLLEPLAKGYLHMYREAIEKESREFFGLRDFYGIVKMVNAFAKRSGCKPTWYELKHSILRNFGGLESVQPLAKFEPNVQDLVTDKEKKPSDPDCSAAGLITACLFDEGLKCINSQSRYLLILTENYAALKIFEQKLFKLDDAIIIFGSSFPRDQEYTQVCRNINRIKICMEAGKKVVLLNLQNLYESLYDALNQYYVQFGGQQFVDLGLGTHRVKCRVHKDFRLIIVSEKQTVYKTFPIPLINRLEKHSLAMKTILSEQQLQLKKQLEDWVEMYKDAKPPQVMSRDKPLRAGDVFIGYDNDTVASIVLHVTEHHRQCSDDESAAENFHLEDEAEVLVQAKGLLLRCATPESVLLVRHTHLKSEEGSLAKCYFSSQTHDNLTQFLQHHLHREQETGIIAQITTHSRLVSACDKLNICSHLCLKPASVWLQSLQAFDTEQQFTKMLRGFFHDSSSQLLILQCDSGDEHATMIASARYNLQQEGRQCSLTDKPRHVLLVLQLPRKAGGCFMGVQGGRWLCYHIDDLHPDEGGVPSLSVLQEHSIGDLFIASVDNEDRDYNDLVEATERLHMGSKSTNITEGSDRSVIPEGADTGDVRLKFEGQGEGKIMREDLKETAEEVFGNDVKVQARDHKGDLAMAQSLDVDKIIRNCVPGAAAMLEEENASSQRKTERVSMLMSLMEIEGRLTGSSKPKNFLSVIKRRVALLLKDKEESFTTETRASSWLTCDAASQQAIVRAGTLRHSVRQHIEAKVIPVLAAVLAFCDADSNLDHMASLDTPDWLRNLWLDLLNTDHFTRLSVTNKMMMLPESTSNHIQIAQHGYRGYRFKAKVPFSWIIRDSTEELIYNIRNTTGFPETSFEERIGQQFSSSQMGSILGRLESTLHAELVQRYLYDFVAMKYCPVTNNQQEIELLFEALMNAAGQYSRTRSTNAFDLDIPTIHLVWTELQPRVQLVHQVLVQWPGALGEILDFRKKNPQHVLNEGNEFVLDILLLRLVLEDLSPKSGEKECKHCNELDESFESRQSWVTRVDCFAAVVERIFGYTTTQHASLELSSHSQEFIKQSRHLWSRISVVRLLIQHVSVENEREMTFKKFFLMWKYFPETTDFKQLGSLENVEKVLKTLNNGAYKYYMGSLDKCSRCKELLEDSVQLPCTHKICCPCTELLLSSDQSQRNCPQCKKPFPENVQSSRTENQEAIEKYVNHKKQFNAFYMAVVSQLCFHGNTPPESEVIQHLLKLVTQESKDTLRETRGTQQMVALKDQKAVDATPVVRSFLLQMLLRSNHADVEQHIGDYFHRCQNAFGETANSHRMKVVLLFVNCWEDSLHRKYQEVEVTQQVSHVTHLLNQSSNYLTQPGLELNKLKGVATVRYCLSIVAGWMVQGIDNQKILGATQKVCEEELVWPRLYLLRQLNRYHGVIKLQEVVARTPWLQDSEPQDTRQLDKFMVYGQCYYNIRQALQQLLITGDMEVFLKDVKPAKTQKEVLLSLYTEVTLGNQSNSDNQKVHSDILNKLDIALTQKLKAKALASELIQNKLGGHNTKMTVMPGELGLVTMVREMMVHMLVILTTGEDSNLTQPLRLLATKPLQMHQRFLPTMPQDDLVYINKAMQSWLKETTNSNFDKLEIYRCPNGHAYTIGDCGRPWSKGTCIECGSLIGGLYHELETGNVKVETVADKTVQGHTLGAPEARQKEAVPERRLGPAATSLLRLLTHMAMSLGANRHPSDVVQLIEPAVKVEQVEDFLFDHITRDLEVLVRSLGRSEEDCVLLVNLVIRKIGQDDRKYNRVDGSLQSKESREQWEEKFSTTYLQPVLENMATELEKAHNKLLEDQRLGENLFLRQVYEAETLPQVDLDPEHIERMPALWRLRDRVTIDDLLQKVNRNVTGHSERGLELFLAQLHKLNGLRLLPRIVQLQQILVQRFSGSLSMAEAEERTLCKVLMNLPQGAISEEVRSLIHDAKEAWILLREHLKNFKFVGQSLPTKLLEMEIKMDTPLAMLLPSWRGQGLCSLAMVYFLCAVQNHFLEEYAEIMTIKLPERVSIQSASVADIISVHPDRELLPLVVAGCNYSVTEEKGLTYSYDLETIAREVRERFVRGRSKLLPEVQTVLYRENFSNAAKFAALNMRVKQERLPQDLHKQVCSEQVPVMCLSESLDSLNLVNAFLVSEGGEKNKLLRDFMVDTLKMKKGLHSDKAMQHCTLSHVKHLWVVLSHQRAKLQAKYDQYPFNHISESYCIDIPPELIDQLHVALHYTNVSIFLECLFEYILLGVKDTSQPGSRQTDEDDMTNTGHPLGYTLYEFLESSEGDSLPILTDPQRFPDQLLVKHAVSTWMEAFRFQKDEGKN